jgi:hypothetical protein
VDHILRRPLIVVEGFDAGKILAPEERFGLSSLREFLADINDNNTLQNILIDVP